MPNWCEGVLKVRGTKEKILEFLRNGIKYSDCKYGCKDGEFTEMEVPRDCPFEYDEYDIFIKNTKDLWIKGTRRMFITSNTIEDYFCNNKTGIETICIDVHQAWAIVADNLKELSKTYGLDFRIFATERGMEFCQLVEVIGGKITRDEEITFDNFVWEAPNPYLGG